MPPVPVTGVKEVEGWPTVSDFEADLSVTLIYAAVIGSLFYALRRAERTGWRVRRSPQRHSAPRSNAKRHYPQRVFTSVEEPRMPMAPMR